MSKTILEVLDEFDSNPKSDKVMTFDEYYNELIDFIKKNYNLIPKDE